MGASPHVSYETFPDQGQLHGRIVDVIFHYSTDRKVRGVVVRDDVTAPHLMLIALQDGRVINGDECQYQTVDLADGEMAHTQHRIFIAVGAKLLCKYLERKRTP